MSGQQGKKALPPITPTKSGDALFRVLGTLARPTYNAIAKITIEGKENLPSSGGYIVVANHTTEIDPITVGYAPFVSGSLPRFLAKDSLFRAPGLGWLMRKMAHIPVVRGSVDARKALITARSVVEAGGAVMIFPEGTTTLDPDNWPMQARTGAARLALATGAPVIPVAHWGDEQILGYEYFDTEDGSKKWKRKVSLLPRKKVRVVIGKPMDITSLVADPSPDAKRTRTELNRVTEVMMHEITALLARARGEQPPAGRWNPKTKRRELPEEATGTTGTLGEPEES